MSLPPAHRGGAGPPLLLLHGFLDTWRVWELVLPALERRHDVLAVTLPGHAGGPPLPPGADESVVIDAVERAMDDAGFATAHVAGNSMGGYLALQLAARGRARSVVALAPAGGWAEDDVAFRGLLAEQRALQAAMRDLAPHADAVMATADGRRRAARLTAVRWEHLPAVLLADQVRWIAGCTGAADYIEAGLRGTWHVDVERIACPVRIVWGTEDRLLPWPAAAARLRARLPHADWVELDDVGHCPQLDVPLEAAQLILGFTAP